jgi:hypothetical protein
MASLIGVSGFGLKIGLHIRHCRESGNPDFFMIFLDSGRARYRQLARNDD